MEDINRFLILLLLIGLLFVIYKYQHLIFTKERFNSIGNLIYSNPNNQIQNNIPSNQNNQQIIQDTQRNNKQYQEPNKVSIDNISQLSINSLEDEDGEREPVYKPDSVLGSLDDNSLFMSDDGSMRSNGSLVSDASSFFF
ncbi:MAG: hypothetical protein MUO21_01080 [Nitrososphaeraceae archaeon]|nr:hypothetical protein [Nitrososphaeraceae archaeon]